MLFASAGIYAHYSVLLGISVPTNISLSRHETVTRVHTDPGEY